MSVAPSKETIEHAYSVVETLSRQLLDVDTSQARGKSSGEKSESRSSSEPLRSRGVTEDAELTAVAMLATMLVRKNSAEAETSVYRLSHQLVVDSTYPTLKLSREQLLQRLRSLNSWDLIEGYVTCHNNLSELTNYNLACYYATIAGSADKGELRDPCLAKSVVCLRSVQTPELRATAEIDPSLEILRARGLAAEFQTA